MDKNDDLVVIEKQEVYAETEKAVLIGQAGMTSGKRSDLHKTWIPIAFINHRTAHQIGAVGDFEIPRWFADKEDLEYKD